MRKLASIGWLSLAFIVWTSCCILACSAFDLAPLIGLKAARFDVPGRTNLRDACLQIEFNIHHFFIFQKSHTKTSSRHYEIRNVSSEDCSSQQLAKLRSRLPFLLPGSLESFRIRSSCFSHAVEVITTECRSLEVDDTQRLRLAVRFTLCELASSQVAPPHKCSLERIAKEVGPCISQLARSPQSWTSYSTSLKDVIKLCDASSSPVQRRHLEQLKQNLTILHLQTANLLLSHHEENLKQWLRVEGIQVEALRASENLESVLNERVAPTLDHIKDRQHEALGLVEKLLREGTELRNDLLARFEQTKEAIDGTSSGISRLGNDLASLHNLANKAVKEGSIKASTMSENLDRLSKTQEDRFQALSLQQDLLLVRWTEAVSSAQRNLDELVASTQEARNDQKVLLDSVSGIQTAIDMFTRESQLSGSKMKASLAYLVALLIFIFASLFFQWGGWIRLVAFTFGPAPFWLAGKLGLASWTNGFFVAAFSVITSLVTIAFLGVRSDIRKTDRERERAQGDEAFRAMILQTLKPIEEGPPRTPTRATRTRKSTPAKKLAVVRSDEQGEE